MQPVLFEEVRAHNGYRIGIATLVAEKTLNAISLEMSRLLTAKLRQWQADPSIAAVILQGKGDKAFCAGGDLLQLHRAMRLHHASPERDDVLANRYVYDFFACEYRLNHLIHTFPKPFISWGNGYVMGGGLGLAVGASHRVVTEHTRLAMPEIVIGLYPDVGGSQFLAQVPDQLGRFLALTGATIGAHDAIMGGMADVAITHGMKQQVLEALLDLPWDGNDHPRVTDVLARFMRQSEKDGVFGPSSLSRHHDLLARACAGTSLQEVVAAIAAIHSDDPWIVKAQQQMAGGAPGSLWLTWELQRKAATMSLADVFRLEMGVSLRCSHKGDFAEGIRALLVDKDRRPQWQHASVADVTQDWGDTFFVPPWEPSGNPLHDLI